ncbi:hypothetical protein KC19_VG269200 [Ceratodon purpureus]|uniref:J domain-containing protein n=1 Tax=Ceratodon purpureus TaxID=3225 RepID=A0A8T0HUV9_CERPU|nr:hypothetical protein KC19_VG269200 [Ceratodon purpureus]
MWSYMNPTRQLGTSDIRKQRLRSTSKLRVNLVYRWSRHGMRVQSRSSPQTLALLLHPNKNQARGAEAAFNLIGEAFRALSDKISARFEAGC